MQLVEIEDERAGVIAAAIHNAMGGKKGGGAFSARDFFPKRSSKGASQEQSPEEMHAVLQTLFKSVKKRL